MKTRKLVSVVLLSVALLIIVLNLSCTLAAGGIHTVGLKDDGTVVAVGDNYHGECDVGASNVVPLLEGYTLTISSTAGGSVTTPGEGTFTYPYVPGGFGKVVSLAATPATGYRFVNWTGDVGRIADVNAAITTITMIMEGYYSITANFVAVYYDLTVSSAAGGSVTTPGEGTFTREAGTVVSLVATPAIGYRFVNWTAPAGSFANANTAQTTFTMPAQDVTVTANFEVIPPVQCTLTISSTAGGSVITPGEGTFIYHVGMVVSLVAIPATGYGFVNWAGDVGTIANVNAATTTITMEGDYEVTARFLACAKTDTVADRTVDAKAEANTEVAVTGTATVTVAGCQPSGWSGYGATPVTSPGQPGWKSLGKYTDVHVRNTTDVTEIEIRLFYTDAEVTAAGVSEESLRLFWWNGTAWVQGSDSGVNTASTNGYSGYMWAKITATTTPSLADLQGTPWGGYGHPTEVNGCCTATVAAASGTNAAQKLNILREFRDAVLLPNSLGTKFVSLYYRTSSPVADFLSGHEVLTRLVRVDFLDPIVKILNSTHDLWSA
jgi:uncharacterized repeat protein (TIGR02543 family)